jgi:calcium-dependent protein kinase
MGCFPAPIKSKINMVTEESESQSSKKNKSKNISIKDEKSNMEEEKQEKSEQKEKADQKEKESINLKKKKSQPTVIKSSTGNLEKICTIKNFKITQGMMVGDSGSDPFKHYEKLDVLGEGSFGVVFRVVHRHTGFIRAMKIIDKQSAALDQDSETSLINEINILKTLDHPNILKVFEYFNTNKKLYIISELCTGGELFDKIQKERKFSEKVTAFIMKQVISAVYFCHLNKVIHRDLKPENIIIVSEKEALKEFYQIKVIDFGTSDKLKKNKMLTMQIGTPYYIAPEVLESFYNEKCDLWSCGVIIYILLCGSPPFFAEKDEEIYKLVKKGKYSMSGKEWSLVSNEAKDLIKQLLTKDIAKRFSAEQVLNHVWFKKMNKILEKENKVSDYKIITIAKNLRGFNANKKLQQATLAYIVHNMLKKEETDEFRKIFLEFDSNGDGRLTKEKLINGLNKVMTPEEAKTEVEKIIGIIDVDGNGFIEYEEFLRAAMNKERILTEKNLQAVFNLFDNDRSGKISIGEIRNILGGDSDLKISDEVWSQIVNDMDGNGDGEVEFKEFKAMMNKLLDSREIVRYKKNRQTRISVKTKMKFDG